jgi:hypothetical protein
MDLRTALSLAYGKEITTKTSLNKENKIRGSYKGKHALRPYLGIVEFPISRGGGSVWVKSATAMRNYEDKNYKVVWL